MKKIMIGSVAAWIIDQELGSCGNESCDIARETLRSQQGAVPLETFVDPKTGHWMKPVFGNLQAYAIEERLNVIGAREVARYFGGKHHINNMIRKAADPKSDLTIMMSLDAGLVLDVMLPLVDGHYRNGRWDLDMGEYVVANPSEEGVPCYHRGLVVNIPLSPADVLAIYEEQQESPDFARAMDKLMGPIKLPPNFLEALRLTRT